MARRLSEQKPSIRGPLTAALAGLALGGPLIPTPAGAQDIAAAARPLRGSARAIQAAQTSIPPVIDGAIEDAAWRAATVTDAFWISLENRPPSEATEVLVMADATHLYFAFRVYDRKPDKIVALQTRRDMGLALDDRVTVELDPFRTFNADATSKFSINARGTQFDEIGSGRARQLSWKGDWKAATAKTDYGWSAEIAIPFAILNFEPKTEVFAINFYRYHNRTRELSQWADTTPQNLPEEIGRVTGLALPVAAKRRTWTFLPYVFAGANVRDSDGDVQSEKGDAGLEIRYEPQPNITGLASLNPDLSQIEKAVTDINFSYNEKSVDDYRPFFREGAAYYGNNESYYFYSNRIPDFDFGLRAFGRVGKSQFGTFVTSSPDGRFDYFAQADYQIDKTHRVAADVVVSDRDEFTNALYAIRGSGRETAGLTYAFEAALSETDGVAGDGSFVQGEVGWEEDYWSASLTYDDYTKAFFPANGIVDNDLLDTRGGTAAAGYYRDFGNGRFYNMQANAYWQRRYTRDGDLQKDYVGLTGSLELRREVRFSLGYTFGKYRPTGDAPGLWEEELNKDSYLTAGLDFNTRNDRLTYGASIADGELAGGDYRYVSAYVTSRPTSTTYLKVSAEQLSLFGTFNQVVITGGWDITPAHNISARVIRAYYGDSLRASWTWRIRNNIDLFVVCEANEFQKTMASMKLVMTLP